MARGDRAEYPLCLATIPTATSPSRDLPFDAALTPFNVTHKEFTNSALTEDRG